MTDDTYADSSALVKLIIEEPESSALRALAVPAAGLVTSHLAMVEVHRAARMAHAMPASSESARTLLASCRLIAVSDDVLGRARALASPRLRTLDAIHLATALRIRATRIITYDRRLIEAASDAGLRVLHPGLAG